MSDLNGALLTRLMAQAEGKGGDLVTLRALGCMVPKLHVTAGATAHGPDAEVIVIALNPGGSVSVRRICVAVDGPRFVIQMV